MKRQSLSSLKAMIDPEDILPRVELQSDFGENSAGLTAYKAWQSGKRVGMALLRRTPTMVGSDTMLIEGLRIAPGEDTDAIRFGAELTILAASMDEGRALVSDPHGVSFEETAMWYRFAGFGIAQVIEPFRPCLERLHGEVIYEGQAVAHPIDLTAISAG